MANIFTNLYNNMMDGFASRIATYINDSRETGYRILSDYYAGDHRKQLKIKEGQQDDNIIQNYTGLVVDRSVSRLFGGGIQFKLPEGAQKQQDYIDQTWKANKQDILLHQLGLNGSVHGSVYVKIVVDGSTDPYTKKQYPRLVAVYPRLIRMKCNPQDMDDVTEYIIEYSTVYDGQEVAYRETTVKQENGFWLIENWEKHGYEQWTLVLSTMWDYDFPPIVNWKNLPSLNSVYGDSDIDDIINVQDKSNFVVSNLSKIVKYHGSPTTIVTGTSADNVKPVDKSPNAMFAITSAEAKAYNLEMSSDLASSRSLALDLRQSIFDISREPDIASADTVGALTNFGLRVLYMDANDKNKTKQSLYGEGLLELNRRLLVLAGFTDTKSDPGEITWKDNMPVNIYDELQADNLALKMGIVTREALVNKYTDRYGLTWEDMQSQRENGIDENMRGGLENGMASVLSGYFSKQQERVTNATGQ